MLSGQEVDRRLLQVRLHSGAMMKPGPTAFTRTPSAACSQAAAFVMPRTPCLAATYALDMAKPTWPKIGFVDHGATATTPHRLDARAHGVEDAVEIHP